VISTEAFELCETNEALWLAGLRRRADEEILIVMIIRDLIDLMPSRYSQKVKSGVRVHAFDAFFKKRMKDPRVDYYATAARWADAFGWANLRVRVLDRDHLLNGDLVDEFLSIIGLDPAGEAAQGLQRTGPANVRPGWKVLEAIRALYGGRHGLPDGHALANVTLHTYEQKILIGRRARKIGADMGWNDDRGQYLTRKQAQRCLDVYRTAIEAMNDRLPRKLPMPLDLEQRGFQEREATPDIAQIPPAELRAFYDKLGESNA
jgi:hypothetical protein